MTNLLTSSRNIDQNIYRTNINRKNPGHGWLNQQWRCSMWLKKVRSHPVQPLNRPRCRNRYSAHGVEGLQAVWASDWFELPINLTRSLLIEWPSNGLATNWSSDRVSEPLIEWFNEWVSYWLVLVNKWMNEQLNVWVADWLIKRPMDWLITFIKLSSSCRVYFEGHGVNQNKDTVEFTASLWTKNKKSPSGSVNHHILRTIGQRPRVNRNLCTAPPPASTFALASGQEAISNTTKNFITKTLNPAHFYVCWQKAQAPRCGLMFPLSDALRGRAQKKKITPRIKFYVHYSKMK